MTNEFATYTGRGQKMGPASGAASALRYIVLVPASLRMPLA